VKIVSPIGEYDYRVDRIAFRRGQLEVAGHLGQWETTTVLEASDLRALGARALPALALVWALCVVTRRRRRV
jgi:hypothetical protein